MKLATWLTANAISRSEFGRRIGVTPAAVGGYCKGAFKPGLRTLAKIEKLTGGRVRAADFLSDEEAAE